MDAVLSTGREGNFKAQRKFSDLDGRKKGKGRKVMFLRTSFMQSVL